VVYLVKNPSGKEHAQAEGSIRNKQHAKDEFGFKINHPSPDELVDIVTVKGAYKKLPPNDYEVRILRVYPDKGFMPVGREVEFDELHKTWQIRNCDIGGQSRDDRALVVAIVGKSGLALFKYFRAAAATHNELVKAYKEATQKSDARYLPLIYDV